MFGVSEKYVDERISTTVGVVDTRLIAMEERLRAADKYTQEKVLALQEALDKTGLALEDIKYFKERLEAESADRIRQERSERDWHKQTARMECLRLASQGRAAEQDILRVADRMMKFVETGVYEEPEAPKKK